MTDTAPVIKGRSRVLLRREDDTPFPKLKRVLRSKSRILELSRDPRQSETVGACSHSSNLRLSQAGKNEVDLQIILDRICQAQKDEQVIKKALVRSEHIVYLWESLAPQPVEKASTGKHIKLTDAKDAASSRKDAEYPDVTSGTVTTAVMTKCGVPTLCIRNEARNKNKRESQAIGSSSIWLEFANRTWTLMRCRACFNRLRNYMERRKRWRRKWSRKLRYWGSLAHRSFGVQEDRAYRYYRIRVCKIAYIRWCLWVVWGGTKKYPPAQP